MNPNEHEIQATVFDWRARMVNQHPELRWLHAIPNGGKRPGRTATQMAREGVTRGVPDVCLPVPKGVERVDGWYTCDAMGLYIEIKTLKGTTTPEQEEWIDGLRKNGYRAEICRGVDATIDMICDYLSIERGY